MSFVNSSGRVGGTQFDDRVIKGITTADPVVNRCVKHCDLCPKAFLPERFDEHMEVAHGTPADEG